jgi:hypothetical protein
MRRSLSICTGPECELPVLAKGFCGGHYRQQHDGEKLRPLRFSMDGLICEGPGCDWPAKCKGFCMSHYRQLFDGRELTVVKRRKRRSA